MLPSGGHPIGYGFLLRRNNDKNVTPNTPTSCRSSSKLEAKFSHASTFIFIFEVILFIRWSQHISSKRWQPLRIPHCITDKSIYKIAKNAYCTVLFDTFNCIYYVT